MVNEQNERGAVLVIVASSMLLLLGFTALAIDAGIGYSDRRGSTNAADNAALAAAWEECNPVGGTAAPAAAALATAAANGYDNASADVEVTAQSLGNGEWQVTITRTNEGAFGVATPFADDELTVVSEAVALCDPTEFLEGMAIFAGAKGCPTEELGLSGSNIDVDGGIHSNGELQIQASANSPQLTGPVTYGETSNPTPPGDLDPIERDYPIDVDITEYRPGGDRADAAGSNYYSTAVSIDNDWLIDEGHAEEDPANPSGIRMLTSGIFYTSNSSPNGAIDLQSVNGNGQAVTFVTEGEIKISGSNANLVGYDPIVSGGTVGMLFFSNYDGAPGCNPSLDAVKFSANAALIGSTGIIFAPNGHVQLSSATIELNGSIIAYMVKSSGASLSISYQNDPNFVPDYRVELLR